METKKREREREIGKRRERKKESVSNSKPLLFNISPL